MATAESAPAATSPMDTPPADAAATDPPGPELARWLAAHRKPGPEPGGSLPSPPDPDDFNPGSLVPSATELASLHLRLPEEGGWVDAPATTLFDLQFSADGSQIFFQADGWGTSLALHRLELDSGQVSFVADANGYSIVRSCPKQPKLEGELVAYRHSYELLLAAAFDAYFLLDDQGGELGVIGPDPQNTVRILTNSCSLGATVPIPPSPTIDPRAKRLPRCGGPERVLRYAPLRFLDGTELPLFYIVKQKKAHAPRLTLDDALSTAIPLEALAGGLAGVCGEP